MSSKTQKKRFLELFLYPNLKGGEKNAKKRRFQMRRSLNQFATG